MIEDCPTGLFQSDGTGADQGIGAMRFGLVGVRVVAVMIVVMVVSVIVAEPAGLVNGARNDV